MCKLEINALDFVKSQVMIRLCLCRNWYLDFNLFLKSETDIQMFKRIISLKMLLFKIEGAEKFSSTTSFKEKSIVNLKGFLLI